MNKNILDLQNYMQTRPLGIDYESPNNGIMDYSLKTALKKLENKIASSLDNSAIKGTIVSHVGELRTGVDDIKKAVALVSGFIKNSQGANLENMESAILEEDRPSATKNQLSNDEAYSQFFSVTPTDSQQIGKPQIELSPAIDINEQEINAPNIEEQIDEIKIACQERFVKLAQILKSID